MEVFRTRSLKDEGHGIKMRRLRKADTDADNIPEKKKKESIHFIAWGSKRSYFKSNQSCNRCGISIFTG